MNLPTSSNQTNISNFLDEDFDLFDFSNLNPIDIKKESIAADLSALISYEGLQRKQMAKLLNQKESQLSKTLSGRENLTIKTISKIVFALGYDFEIVFHKNIPNVRTYMQPWESLNSYLLNLFNCFYFYNQTFNKINFNLSDNNVFNYQKISCDIEKNRKSAHLLKNDELLSSISSSSIKYLTTVE